jgi:hypothetical protein
MSQEVGVELTFDDEKTREQRTYEEYKEIKANYEKDLCAINA